MNQDKSVDMTQQTLETRSYASGSKYSMRSSRSSVSSAGFRARAKAQTAQAQISYAEKEADMIKLKAAIEAEAARHKAELEENMHVLKIQRAAVAASAEAAVYEAAAELEEEPLQDFAEITTHNSVQRTHEYVQNHALDQDKTEHAPIQHMSSIMPQFPDSTYLQSTPSITDLHPPSQTDTANVSTPRVRFQESRGYADPQHPSHYMDSHISPLRNSTLGTSETTDLAKHLIRRELVSTGLLTFDDRPENYWAWKTSFQGVTRDLNLTAREELDLLTKWLGPESSQQAKRIRSVHVHNPIDGVKMVWQRLEECYGSPEAIENALLMKLENFPKISNKDNIKLRELCDMLAVNAAKTGGFLSGLAYLDTARGIRPIIEKLPYSLQEKCFFQGSKYKEDHHVSFPPFSFFTRFIVNQAKTRNDPSFIFSTCSNQFPVNTEKSGTRYSNRPTVSVRKTEVSATNATPQVKSPSWKSMESDSPCPIHNKPHPLS
ncbi:uncharacterized protein LOC128655382 [Bombina bombina]|uniref:uncharacterized protein LOC128655382 n=1 Tax=Bombina bombina TaxID=8345 RepID=UPI00235A99F2|nr:uncharacterized protein LOC128655382 [Bombina bombina]